MMPRFTITPADADNASGACGHMRFDHDSHALAHYYRAVARRVSYYGGDFTGQVARAYVIQAWGLAGTHDGAAIWKAAA